MWNEHTSIAYLVSNTCVFHLLTEACQIDILIIHSVRFIDVFKEFLLLIACLALVGCIVLEEDGMLRDFPWRYYWSGYTGFNVPPAE